MQEQEKMMDNMVKMCFQESGTISLRFNTPEEGENKSRIIQSKEVRVVRNGKPVLHARKFSDSANPKNNGIKIIKTEDEEEEND